MRRIALVLLLSIHAACPSGTYFTTVRDFATTASDSVTALEPASGFRSKLCHLGMRYGYVFDRLKTPVVDPDTQQPITFADFETNLSQGKGTWAIKCAVPAASDALVDKALIALAAYAKALGNVANDDFPGKAIAGLGSDASSLAKAISDKSLASGIAASLADPISAIAMAIANHYKRKDLAEVVANNDVAVMALVGGVNSYLEQVGKESQDTYKKLRDVLNSADAIIKPGDTLPYIVISARWIGELQDIDKAIASTRDAMKQLGDAEMKLKAAGGRDDLKDLADVLGDMATIINDVQAVRMAIAGKAAT